MTVEGLASLAGQDLTGVWARFSTAQAARDQLQAILPTLVRLYGQAAATYAADWYAADRYDQQIVGAFTPTPVDVTEQGADVLARWGVAPLFGDEPDLAAARALITGGLQRRIANASRDTIAAATVADPQARGWQRIGNGSCGFCRMLIDRGAVYSEATATFPSHDHCRCSAVPAWGGRPLPATQYKPKPAGERSPADYARARQWMKAHGY